MNSSSTHSMLLLGPNDTLPGTTESSDFGWEHWTAASREAKTHYFALMLLDNLRTLYPQRIAQAVVKELFNLDISGLVNKKTGEIDGYVDHQSMYTFPRSWDEKELNYEFIEDFRELFMQDRLILTGGNDNTEESHPLNSLYKGVNIPDIGMEGNNTGIVARKDPIQKYWTIFNRRTGAKLRFNFDKLGKEPKKAAAPELVDIKLTDFCPYACAFCYQGSTMSGKHGNTQEIMHVLDELAKNEVFEIAFGGGEPSLHPDFISILQHTRRRGMVPNFTTKNLAWLRNPKQTQEIMEVIGGFAYSVETAEDIEELVALLKVSTTGSYKVTVQHVVGTNYDLSKLLASAYHHNVPITLLGYKLDGRGKEFSPKLKASDAFEQVKKFTKDHYLRLGIDTALAKEWEPLLVKDKVSRTLYHTEEGKFSMYIDTVTGMAGASSYNAPSMKPYGHKYYDSKTYKYVERPGQDLMAIFQEF